MNDRIFAGPRVDIVAANSKPVVVITPDGTIMRGDGKPLDDCSRNELLVLVHELVDLFRGGVT